MKFDKELYAKDIDKELRNMEDLYSQFGCDFTADVEKLMLDILTGEIEAEDKVSELFSLYRQGRVSADDLVAMFKKGLDAQNADRLYKILEGEKNLGEDAEKYLKEFRKDE